MISNILRLVCWIAGHRYYTIKAFSLYVRKVGCSRCNAQWGMHDGVKAFVEWDLDLERLSKEMYG